MTDMPDPAPAKKWRKTRICLRCCWFTILLLALLLLTAVIYLNEVGLPGPLKTRLVEQLRTQGVDLQFTRLRWRWYRGIVADNVFFGAAKPQADVPQFSIKEVDVHFDYSKLIRLKFQVDSLKLDRGQLVWPLAETNQSLNSVSMTNIQTQLRLLPGDFWELDHFTANFAGARLRLSGSVSNASAFRDWSVFHAQARAEPELLRLRLHELAKAIDQIKFARPPELTVVLNGDARDVQSFSALITLDAAGAETPWGTLTNAFLAARLNPPNATNRQMQAECKLRAEQVDTKWASTRHFQLDLHGSRDEILTNIVRAQLEISAAQAVTPWAEATNARFTAHWTHSLTNAIPLEGSEDLRLADIRTRWGTIGKLHLQTSLAPPATNAPVLADASWGWWAQLEPYFLDWNCRAENIHAQDFILQQVVCGGNWRAPQLTITNLHTEMYQGQFTADATLNVATRLASFNCVSDFDVQKAVPILTPGAQKWFENQEFAWENPPLLRGGGSVILPAWTNQHPNWKTEVTSTLVLNADFKVGAASYHKVPVTSAQSHITYSNMIWRLPDLVATCPEGSVKLEHISDDRTSNYYFHVWSQVYPRDLRPSLTNAAVQRALDMFSSDQPPLIEAELWGRWRDYTRIGARAEVTVSNFTFRGESANYFHGYVQYTNNFVVLTNARVDRTNQYLTAEAVGFDIAGKKGFLTNGFSIMEPMVVLRVIGPKVTRDVEPYHFVQPPTVSAYGVIPLSDDISVADMHFKIDGGPFEWMKFHLPHVAGMVNWTGQSMTLSGMSASFYGGKLTGTAAFDFHRKNGSDFSFDTIVTGASLQSLMSDISPRTNHLEGTFGGHLNIVQANSADLKSWFGKGNVDLRDGLIWEIPIFGIFSPLLDGISPGLGKSRLSEASGTFVITNSVIRSGDLEIRSPAVRLFYNGTVDFDMNVDAVVEAQVGRDTPLVGPVVSMFFSPFTKLFRSKVTGTLANPKQVPEFLVTKMISPFLHPFRTLRDLWPSSSSDTNTPPVWPQNKSQ
jgi:hypothetical protein